MVLLVKAFMRLYVAFTPSVIPVMLAGKGRIVMENLRELSLEGRVRVFKLYVKNVILHLETPWLPKKGRSIGSSYSTIVLLVVFWGDAVTRCNVPSSESKPEGDVVTNGHHWPVTRVTVSPMP